MLLQCGYVGKAGATVQIFRCLLVGFLNSTTSFLNPPSLCSITDRQSQVLKPFHWVSYQSGLMLVRFQRSPACSGAVRGELQSSSKLVFSREEEHKSCLMLNLSLVFKEAKGSAGTLVTLYD